MKHCGFSRYALGIAAALLAACGGSQPPIGTQQSRAIATHAKHGGSWMRPDAAKDDLAYVASVGVVDVYSYPKGVLAGALEGFGIPEGLCVDVKQDVWVPDQDQQNLTEFAHGNSYPIQAITRAIARWTLRREISQ